MVKEITSETKLVSYGIVGKILYHALSFMDGYDLQMLSVCMRAFEITLGLSPSSLAIMATVETVALVACCPIWGYLVDAYRIGYVLGTAMALSGISTMLMGCVSNFGVILALRVIHGCAMGCTPPTTQKLITLSTDEKSHAAAFGLLHCVACLGRLISAVLVTYVAGFKIMGYPGWRPCYLGLGLVWLTMSAITVFFLKPVNGQDCPVSMEERSSIKDTLRAIFQTATCKLLLLVVFISDAPFCAFAYIILFLQYSGVTDMKAGITCGLTLIGGCIGGGFGGFIVDWCHKKSNDYGRLHAANVIMVIRLVACIALFMGPAPDGDVSWYHIVELMTLGASLMTVSSIDRPILASVVQKKYQASATGLIRCIAGVLSTIFFLPLCGFLAEKAFGYKPSTEPIATMLRETRVNNGDALRKSIMYILLTGTIANALCYAAFFFTYPHDAKANERADESLVSETSDTP
ncbi:transporter, putative [Babesia bigemina]|uniref:Transporter, putative n=1 Tax=Babesia bigemina TaxID=5866 RepID=A0A061D6U2_BABBI|nr:transporter, putative [Babesia bigemina]CDR94654.1 transporter, putative [Babesia bigemina]|eukprot:XP_012766840.1 transporter, putative [Babesia bigemina]